MNDKQSIIPEPIPDERVKEILRLSEEGKFTQAGIASEVGVSRATVGKYIRKRKRQLAPKIPRRFGDGDLQSLCEILVPLMREKLKEENPDKSKDEEEKTKKEKEEQMGDEELAAKVQMLLERQRQQERMASDLAALREDITTLKEQGKQVPEQLIQEIGDLKAGMEGIKKDTKDTKDFCTKFPELCEGQKRLEQKISQIEQKASEPKTIKFSEHELGHADVKEMFECCNSDDPESCSTNKLCDQIPPGLQAKMLRLFCTNEACVKELEKQGFQLDGEGYREKYKGFLGG